MSQVLSNYIHAYNKRTRSPSPSQHALWPTMGKILRQLAFSNLTACSHELQKLCFRQINLKKSAKFVDKHNFSSI